MAQNCPNCKQCTCSGSYLIKASNGKLCCTHCVNAVNKKLASIEASRKK